MQEWLIENGLNEATGGRAEDVKARYHSPYELLAQRTGLTQDTVWRQSKGDRSFKSMQFDQADRFLCATERTHWWWHDPELSEHYERACKGADAIYPLTVAA